MDHSNCHVNVSATSQTIQGSLVLRVSIFEKYIQEAHEFEA